MGLPRRREEKALDQYRSLLLDGIAPFWLERGIDREYGGVLSCMSDDGQVLSGDKFIWSQARSVWTFSALYNRIEPRPEFLEAAENSVRFLLAHGRDDRGRWVYHTDREGRVLEGATSIYADCFAIYGSERILPRHAGRAGICQWRASRLNAWSAASKNPISTKPRPIPCRRNGRITACR